MNDPARHVATLIERMLVDYASEYADAEAVDADMRGMMAAVEVTLSDGSKVLVEVEELA